MNVLKPYPFVRLLLPFIAGIVAAFFTGASPQMPALFLSGLVLTVLYVVFLQPSYRKRWMPGMIAYLALAVLGYLVTSIRIYQYVKNPVSDSQEPFVMLVRLIEPVVERQNNYRTVAKMILKKDGDDHQMLQGRVLLYFRKDSLSSQLFYGDEILVKGWIKGIAPPGNPHEFDYRRYMADRGVLYTSYIGRDQWKLVTRGMGSPVRELGYRIRGMLAGILKDNHVHGHEFAVASAIMLGMDEYLDSEQIREYSGAGAMHILCVSGLHVGIIAWVLHVMLGFLRHSRCGRILKPVLLIGAIWCYALITGFSPSVMRASVMFSFVSVGMSLKRRPEIFNTLAASALLLLLYNPFFLRSTGFQLSYLAVAGILAGYPLLQPLWEAPNRLLDKIWKITVVSVCAQIATAPLAVYYFHQFPNYFLLTNLIAIPMAGVILYAGILFFLVSPVPLVSTLSGTGLSYLIRFLNVSIETIENLPGSVTQSLYLQQGVVVMVYLAIIFLGASLIIRERKYLWPGLGIICLVLMTITRNKNLQLQQQAVIVYNVPKGRAIDFILGRQHVLLADSIVTSDPRTIDYHIRGNWLARGIRSDCIHDFRDQVFQNDILIRRGPFIEFAGFRAVLVDEVLPDLPESRQFPADLLVLFEDPGREPADLIRTFPAGSVVLSMPHRKRDAERLDSAFLSMGITCWNTSRSGARVVRVSRGKGADPFSGTGPTF
ncbi:MAG: ComEC/Rec2 family competence protein [Bacteroidales bacterium]|nr:ComEC/Rec2 family competence protein [Bacteroidales bacterium]